jgi:hypothetical protein
MPRTRTLAQLRTEIRNRGDLLSVRHSDDELTRNINQSIADLYTQLVDLSKDYFLSSVDVSVTSGTANYNLSTAGAADVYKILGVDVQDSGRWYSLRRFNWSERNQLQDSGSTKRNTRYRVMADNVRLRPDPGWSGTLRVWYIPAPSVLSADSDTFDGIAGWEEYVILDCIIKARIKDEESYDSILNQKTILEKKIRAQANERDDGEPDRVRDVESECDYDSPSYWSP